MGRNVGRGERVCVQGCGWIQSRVAGRLPGPRGAGSSERVLSGAGGNLGRPSLPRSGGKRRDWVWDGVRNPWQVLTQPEPV